jgi:DNA repair protein RecN (Recombination protein N)
LSVVWKRLADLSSIDARFTPFLDERASIKPALEELAHTLRSYGSDLEASPDRLQRVEDRLAALDRLKKKHGPSLDDVIASRQALEEELNALGAGEAHVATLEAREDSTRRAFIEQARVLSSSRRQAAGELSRALEGALAELAMPHCRVEILVVPLDNPDDWSRQGMDHVEFYLSPNPGEDVRPLARIVSGGELSRIMLALRTLAPTEEGSRTLIFDEVDAGIGGEAADAVGGRLQLLARKHQVICITHLAQVAARPGAHLHMSKEVRAGRTHTLVKRLDSAARELEIARMIAGAGVSPQVLASARELLAIRRESEQNAKGESPLRAKAKGRRGGA